MRRGNRRILNSFDWFVVLVLLGYLLVGVQSMWQGGTLALPFTSSSQLRDEQTEPPADLSDGKAISLRANGPRLIEIE